MRIFIITLLGNKKKSKKGELSNDDVILIVQIELVVVKLKRAET